MIDNFKYDLGNIGWKLHIPVEADFNNELTRDICDFLNQRYNVTTPTGKHAFHVKNNVDGFSLYKIGSGGKSGTGKGMTIYTASHTQEEAFNLAKELETRFGDRLAKTGFNIADEYSITPNVSARFVLDEGSMTNYCTHKGFGQSTGTLQNVSFPKWVRGNPILENEFRAGYSMLECIDSCGTLMTGDLSKGTPKFITEAFGQNFLKEYPNLLQELPQRVHNGDINFAKQVLRKIGKGNILTQADIDNELRRLGTQRSFGHITSDEYIKGANKIKLSLGKFSSKLDSIVKLNYVVNLNPNIISEALEQIATETPEVYNNLRTNLPSILKTYPELQPMKQVISMAKPSSSVCSRLGIKFLHGGKPAVNTQVAGITAPTTGVQMAKVDMDSVFSTFTRGECRPKVVKPTTPVLQDVIEGALEKVHKPVITRPPVATTPNMAKILKTVFTHIRI